MSCSRLVDDRAAHASRACKSLILPAITLGLFQITLIMRLVRAEMLEVLRTDYIKFARARGLSERAVYFRHALQATRWCRSSPSPACSSARSSPSRSSPRRCSSGRAWALLFVQAVQFVDIPVMAAYLMFVAFVFVVINLIVDLLYVAARSAPQDRRRRGGTDGATSPARPTTAPSLPSRGSRACSTADIVCELPAARRSSIVAGVVALPDGARGAVRAADRAARTRSTSRSST